MSDTNDALERRSVVHVWLYALASVTLVSLLSLAGLVFLATSERRLNRIILTLLSLAIGALFGDTFFHLLPDAFANSAESTASPFYVLAGLFTFLFLEKFLRWRDTHALGRSSIQPIGYINLISDGIHNLIDGMLIGASYLVDLRVGIATTTAVILHEIPHEIGDFGVLIHAGFTRKQALLLNFLSASLAIAGAIISLLAGSSSPGFSRFMTSFTAGGFIYIAGSNLLPEVLEEVDPYKSMVHVLAMMAGVAFMFLLKFVE